MTAVAASGVAMTAVAASKIARDAILASPVALDAIYASAIAIGKFAAGVAGLDPALYDDIAAVTQSSAAMEAVTASTIAMEAVTASTIAMEAVANSKIARDAVFAKTAALNIVRKYSMSIAKFAIGCAGRNPANYSSIAAVVSDTAAMTAIAGSSTAMTAIYGSQIARKAIEGSNIACTALEKVAQVVSPTTDPYLYNGKCFLVAVSQKWSKPTSIGKASNSIGNYVDAPTSSTEDVYYNYNNYDKKINRFASSVEIKSSTWGGSATGYWNGAKIVKIK